MLKISLATGTDPEEFQLVRDGLEAVPRGNIFLQLPDKTFLNYHHRRTPGANEMMMVPVVALCQKLEPRHPIAEIKALHHLHAFQQVHRAIDRGEVAVALRQRGEDLLVGHGLRMPAENLQNGLARTGDLA